MSEPGLWTAARTHPFTYPGARPSGSYALVHDQVRPYPQDLDVSGRTPVLTYGANANPGTILVKLAHHGVAAGPDTVVPVRAATLEGYDAVAGGLSQQGYLYADLAPSPGTELAVHVMLLDAAQLAVMHDSERVRDGNYRVGVVDVVLDDGSPLRAMAYVGSRPVFRSPVHGSPIALSAIGATGRVFPSYATVGALAHALEAVGVLASVRTLAGLAGDTPAEECAREVMRVLNGQWWYRHHTGDRRARAAVALEATVVAALRAHPEGRALTEVMEGQGRLLDAEAAYSGRV